MPMVVMNESTRPLVWIRPLIRPMQAPLIRPTGKASCGITRAAFTAKTQEIAALAIMERSRLPCAIRNTRTLAPIISTKVSLTRVDTFFAVSSLPPLAISRMTMTAASPRKEIRFRILPFFIVLSSSSDHVVDQCRFGYVRAAVDRRRHLPVFHDQDPIAHADQFGQLFRDHQDRFFLFPQILQQIIDI